MKNLKEAVKFGVALAHGVDRALEDKKITVIDLPYFFEAFTSAPEAFRDADKIKDELIAMTKEQKDSFLSEVKMELNLSNEKTEQVIEESLEIVIRVLAVINLVKK